MSHLYDGLDYGSIIGIDCDITHERLIDFEFINLELLEIAQRGIRGPKSINGHAYPARVQVVHDLDGGMKR